MGDDRLLLVFSRLEFRCRLLREFSPAIRVPIELRQQFPRQPHFRQRSRLLKGIRRIPPRVRAPDAPHLPQKLIRTRDRGYIEIALTSHTPERNL